MSDVVLNKKEILSIMEGGQVDAKYSNYVEIPFMPIPLAMDVIEKEKKRGAKTPVDLRKLFDLLPECVNVIPLSQHGLYEAMNDPNFSEKYINRTGNPFEFATEASTYEYEGWWDCVALLTSLSELSWV